MLKKLYALKGIHADWDHLGDLSACIKFLMALKDRMTDEMGTAYHGTHHTTPKSVAKLCWRVYNSLASTGILTQTPNRQDNEGVTPFIDLLEKGDKLLAKSALKNFNQRMAVYRSGDGFELEEDELDPMDFADLDPCLEREDESHTDHNN